ncbi:hypothetical protein MZD04_gp234 [Pseudomonas phage Psa21]|uniref:Uncharacterized protein n=1 Tax=Pseudomonas phage Psa21 TaxID=2530023 RepID=A0A481W4N9_9CAUD|nr:hypothetical protein MZD04_gp234 [Pseudomonas phage Psa21]QBJ02760.1 hypothetical protein PSA21_234 [Pseudomonas phage Psa21]
MQKVLNLSTITRDNPFSVDNQTSKQTATGLNFYTYRGLRMYLITGSNEPGWLHARYAPDFDKLHRKQAAYVYVRDLQSIMRGALVRDIAKRPMVKLIANRKTEVITDSDSPADIEWRDIVQSVVSGL